jgi:U3 small nucleolar RNA-associated protein 14
VFKRGKQGVGYYQDAGPPLSSKAARQAAKQKQQQQQRGTPQVLVNQEGDGSDGEGGDPDQQQAARGPALANGRSSRGQQQQAGAAGDGSEDEEARPEMQAAATNAELQRRLLQQAFAGDDVAAEFAAEKASEVAAELPPVEAPSALPGWGSWAGNQKEPAWMAAARRKAEKVQAAAAAARKDAKLQNVILSEKWDKKAAKYLAPQLPFPYNKPGVYETSIRQALGRETNTDAAFRNLTRPAVLKDTGVVIEPIRFSKAVAHSARKKEGVGRAVVTVAGGMVKEGQVKGTGAGGLGKGLPKKAKQARKQH